MGKMVFVIPYYILCMEKSGTAFTENYQCTILRRLTCQILPKLSLIMIKINFAEAVLNEHWKYQIANWFNTFNSSFFFLFIFPLE